ncbi:MAG: phosphoribosylanthranilate isomerase [Candidatus Polarisedimenticolaceae bacterium]|nr:phosphoribosylanthranilate isomerase [Candidatus Polarisedimenticolaceae bacterium]
MRTRIKICGITRPEDGLAAVNAGADAIGLVFYPPSPRAVTIAQAQAIVKQLPPFVTMVALFVNETRGRIEQILQQVSVDLLQFHGDESPEMCEGHGRPWIKAVRMKEGIDLTATATAYAASRGLLLDAYEAGRPGGTGNVFDWQRIPTELAGRIILAGGLHPDNIEAAVQAVRPWAVDVSGGVEATKGIKEAQKIAAFIRGVKRGDES